MFRHQLGGVGAKIPSADPHDTQNQSYMTKIISLFNAVTGCLVTQVNVVILYSLLYVVMKCRPRSFHEKSRISF